MSAAPAGVLLAEKSAVQLLRGERGITAMLVHKDGERAKWVQRRGTLLNHMVASSQRILIVVVSKKLVANKVSDGASFLPDRVRRAFVVDIDEEQASSGKVLIVGDGHELLI